ncbi:hypothetical protein V2E39_22705 [Chryseobacterium arthrosphaerae]|uniref:Uncharacterized protein n=1 Tax=Chryseobacterium arthrosphaerae TaxID=651561 RepID=A0ABU7R601_9FLAO
MINQIVSTEFLIQNGFQEKQSDEVYYESVICSNGPGVTIYVYHDSAVMVIGSGSELPLSIKSENHFSEFIQTMQKSML